MASQRRQCELCLRPYCHRSRCLADLASRSSQLSDGAEGGSWWETGPAMAYSRTSHRFLVAWRTIAYGVSGRLVDSNGSAMSGVVQLAPPAAGAGQPRSGAGVESGDRRVRTDHIRLDHDQCARRRSGGFVPRTATCWDVPILVFRVERSRRRIDVNTTSNNYVVAWGLHPGTMTATLDPWGNVVTSNLATGRLGFDQSLGMSFNPGGRDAPGSEFGSQLTRDWRGRSERDRRAERRQLP